MGIKSCKMDAGVRLEESVSKHLELFPPGSGYIVWLTGELGAIWFGFSFRNSMMRISKQIWGMRMAVYVTILEV